MLKKPLAEEPSPYVIENIFPLGIYVAEFADVYISKRAKNQKFIRIIVFESI